MKCTCPKCHADIEIDLPEVTEEGSANACPECKARLFVHKESFGARALRRTGEISCALCGDELGPHTHCAACGAPYPEYLVVAQGNKRSVKTRGHLKLKSSPFAKSAGAAPRAPSFDPTALEKAPGKTGTGGGLQKKHLVIGLSLVLLVVLGAFGYVVYSRGKAEAEYADKFVKMTYCIHSGQARSLKACTKIAADWKLRNDAGQGAAPRISIEEEKDFALLKSEFQTLQKKMETAPKKYQQCNDMLAKLFGPAQKIQSLALSPSPTLPGLIEATTRYDAEYHKSVREFKAVIPEDLMKELQSASQRYKALKPLVGS